MIRTIKSLTALFAFVLVTACGGGGGSAGDPPFGNGDGGGGGGDVDVAADLSLALSATSVPNNGSDVVTATVTAVDANRNALAAIPIIVSVDSDAVATLSGEETDDKGVVTADVSIGANRSNRVITVTAVSGAISRTASFRVTGAKLTATVVPAVVQPKQSGKVEFRLIDVTTNPMIGQEIIITSGGVETTGTTGQNGEFEYKFVAPATAGPFEIQATAGGTSVSANVDVQAGPGTIPVAVGPVQARSISVNPSVVSVNTAGTTNRSEVRALFLAAENAPIKNIRVRFDLNGDPLSVGGTFTSGNSVVYSDPSGVATSAYVPGTRSSPPDGVTIRACWDYGDFPAGSCPNSITKALTVVSEALSVSIGTDALLEEGSTGLDYVKRYLVQVVDAAGQAKADVQISAPVDLVRYYKGTWVIDGDKWSNEDTLTAACENEDINRNGSIDVYSNGVNEDANGTSALEPRKADVSVSFEGSSRTNGSGQVVLRLAYPKNVASWVYFNLVVSAAGIAGSEGKANFQGVLPVDAEAVNNIEADPPFRFSPYGREGSPVIAITPPGRTTPSLLCTNPN
jgi:hypothetical protein